MTEQTYDFNAVDFDAVYRGTGPLLGDISFERPPWDIGAAQPVLIETEKSGGITGTVLDVGCGAGNNAIFLAQRGYSVTAVDGSDAALEVARSRAAEAGVQIEFRQAEATRLDGVEQRYDTVVDSALYHCLPDDARAPYAAAIHRVAKPGARLHLFCFADYAQAVSPFPTAVSKDDLHRNLGKHWDIGEIAAAKYQGAITVEAARREFGKLGPRAGELNLDAAETDENGWVIFPVWHLTATRR